MYTQKGKKYIYSVIQANEFIQMEYRCLETGFNSKQRKYFGYSIITKYSPIMKPIADIKIINKKKG